MNKYVLYLSADEARSLIGKKWPDLDLVYMAARHVHRAGAVLIIRSWGLHPLISRPQEWVGRAISNASTRLMIRIHCKTLAAYSVSVPGPTIARNP